MLQLFQSIFGRGEECSRYPETLVKAAIERVVDGTDPRLRALPGYGKQLRIPVHRAIDRVVALVDRLPAPLPADRKAFASDGPLSALFASADHMEEVFTNDANLRAFREGPQGRAEQVTALLVMERVERRILGIDMVGDLLRREVAQVAVNFSAPRLVDPSASEEETRRQLKRRAFDHLLSLALLRITEVKGERADLSRQRALLHRKLGLLEHGNWDFGGTPEDRPDPLALQAELAEIEGQLAALGADVSVLQGHLEIAINVLTNAQQQLWGGQIELRLDRMNVQRDAQDMSARSIRLLEFQDIRGRRKVIQLLSIPLTELPQREDFFTAAQRYL